LNFGTKKRDEVEINLTPLIDVVFLLLIFFMVSTKFVSDSTIEVELPFSGLSELVSETQWLEVAIEANGDVSINGKAVGRPGPKAMQGIFSNLLKSADAELVLSIRADGRANYQTVIDVVDAARTAGVQKIAFATQYRRK